MGRPRGRVVPDVPSRAGIIAGMTPHRFLKPIVVLCLMCTCLLARGQESPPPARSLLLRPAPGKPALFVYKSYCQDSLPEFDEITRARGKEPSPTSHDWYYVEMSLEITEAASGGATKGILGFGAVRSSGQDPLTRPLEELTRDQDPDWLVKACYLFDLLVFEGHSFHIEFDRAGMPTKVLGTEAAASARIKSMGLGAVDSVAISGNMVPEVAMAAVRNLLPAAPFPSAPVKKGKTWKSTGGTRISVLHQDISWVQELKAGEAEGDVLPLTGEGRIVTRSSSPRSSGGGSREVRTITGTGFQSESRWSLVDGLPLSFSSSGYLEYKEHAGREDTRIVHRREEKVTLNRVEKWPSGRKVAPPSEARGSGK